VRVLHVITRLAGGSGGNTVTSALGMDTARYEVSVAAAGGGSMWADLAGSQVRTVPLRHMREEVSPAHDLLAALEILRLLRTERFTVVHTHCAKAGAIARVAARLAGTPVVVHTFHALAAHDAMSRQRRWAYLLLERLLSSSADRYVAVAPRLARQVVERRLAPPGKVVVVPSGLDRVGLGPVRRGTFRRELGIAADVPLVGTVGRLVAQKAPLDFVRMAALVQQRHPRARFVMVGDTELESRPLEAETRAEAARLGVDVLFTGHRPDAAALVADLDVYVVPSLHEGLGRALTEAMLAGRPVVATAVNGVPDLVEPGATGLLVPPRSPAALADCVSWLIDHPKAAAAMGEQGRNRVRGSFGVDVMCRGLDAIYAELLGSSSAPAPESPAATSSGVAVIRQRAVPRKARRA
jgi:glycosyltransferase involved in cell wall biosynthesis